MFKSLFRKLPKPLRVSGGFLEPDTKMDHFRNTFENSFTSSVQSCHRVITWILRSIEFGNWIFSIIKFKLDCKHIDKNSFAIKIWIDFHAPLLFASLSFTSFTIQYPISTGSDSLPAGLLVCQAARACVCSQTWCYSWAIFWMTMMDGWRNMVEVVSMGQ